MCRRILSIAVLILAASFLVTGCKTSSTSANPPTAPAVAQGYQNQADQVMGQSLEAAHQFYTSMQSQSVAGTAVLSAAEKTALNAFGLTLNTAQATYLAYHQGTATQAQAQAAVNSVTTAQATLQGQLQTSVTGK